MSAIVLDTCAWIFLGEDIPMASAAFAAIRTAQAADQLFVPTIAVFEIVQKAAKGRIAFRAALDARSWLATALDHPGVQTVPLSVEIAVESYALPGSFHGDPADRVIVATARLLRVPVVTRDARILAYARNGYVDAVGA